MGDLKPSRPVKAQEDEYKSSMQAVVDDNMRTDVLGPGFCKVLDEHIPTSNKLKLLFAEAIKNDDDVKKSLDAFLVDSDTKRKGKWMDRAIGAVVTIFITLIIGALTKFLLG